MIIVTGAAGFIGSCLVNKLNEEAYYDLVLVDDFSRASKKANWENCRYSQLVERSNFIEWLAENQNLVQFIFHLGARTDTTEFDNKIFEELNVAYSKDIWSLCVANGIPLVYASSAATYGGGEFGYDDDESQLSKLKPLNPYGESKQVFDEWALAQKEKPYFWAGLKFFNVYGPNEYHKGRMASVIFHAYNQIQETGKMKLFQSHKEAYEHGEQKRDFIYVKDLVEVCFWLMLHRKNSGIYNLGTGKARSFNDLVKAVFSALELTEDISYIPTPEDIRDKYQYFTEANMGKLKSIGYTKAFSSLEEGVSNYVQNYLQKRPS